MAIGAIDFNGVSRLAVKLAVAVRILAEMAIHAVHAFFEVDVLEVHGFAEFFWIIERNDVVFLVEQVSLAVFFVDGAEDPAVAVEVGELRMLQILFEFGARNFFQKGFVAP